MPLLSTISKVHRDKFQPRTTPHILVGYPFEQKGYKLMSLATKKIHVSRDVIFHEELFPFTLSSTKCTFTSILAFIPNTDFIDCTELSPYNTLSNDHNNEIVTNTDMFPHSDTPLVDHHPFPSPHLPLQPPLSLM